MFIEGLDSYPYSRQTTACVRMKVKLWTAFFACGILASGAGD